MVTHKTAAAAVSSRSNASNASNNALAVGPLTALRACGRSRITVVTAPLRSPGRLLRHSSDLHQLVVPTSLSQLTRKCGVGRPQPPPGQPVGSSSSGRTGSVNKWRTMRAAVMNRPGPSTAPDIVASNLAPGAPHASMSHSRGGLCREPSSARKTRNVVR